MPEPSPQSEPAPVAPNMMDRLVRQVRRFFIVLFGFTLIVFGFLLGFVPGIPGWPLGLLGLTILAGEYVWARRILKRVNEGANRLRDVLFPRWSRRRQRRLDKKQGQNDATG
ncbi:MAG TPA: PGPGW domain-containing protein [Candidatus Thermoplasmatota archaeon]|nr:PGPGW domain-containing protein [Candidatus Thermoplasmatota archaeon]